MIKEYNISLGGLFLFLLIILCIGEPDLLDVLIEYVQSQSNK